MIQRSPSAKGTHSRLISLFSTKHADHLHLHCLLKFNRAAVESIKTESTAEIQLRNFLDGFDWDKMGPTPTKAEVELWFGLKKTIYEESEKAAKELFGNKEARMEESSAIWNVEEWIGNLKIDLEAAEMVFLAFTAWHDFLPQEKPVPLYPFMHYHLVVRAPGSFYIRKVAMRLAVLNFKIPQIIPDFDTMATYVEKIWDVPILIKKPIEPIEEIHLPFHSDQKTN